MWAQLIALEAHLRLQAPAPPGIPKAPPLNHMVGVLGVASPLPQ